MQKRLGNLEKISYGIGAYGKDFTYGMVMTFLMVFYTDVVKVSPIFVGTLFLCARIWDGINDPIMGLIVDNTKTRWGKFRPWILGGTIINSIILILLFMNPSNFLQGTMVYIWCSVTYVVWGMTYTLMDVPYWSMIPSFSNNPRERDQMAVIPRLFAHLGSETIGTFGLMIIAFLGVNMGGTTSDGYFRFAIIGAIIFNICEFICVYNTREHILTKNPAIKLKEVWNIIIGNKQLLTIICMTILQRLGAYLFVGMVVYLFKYVVRNELWFAFYGTDAFIIITLAMLIFPALAKKYSHRKIYIGATVGLITGLSGLFFVTADGHESNLLLFMFFISIYLICNALVAVATTIMLANNVDYSEYLFGKRTDAIVFSVQTFTVKLGTALAGFISGLILSYIGYVPNAVQSEFTLLGLRSVMFLASSGIFFIILLIYIKFYKLHGSFYANILKELSIRNANLDTENK